MPASLPIERLQRGLDQQLSQLARLLAKPDWQGEESHDFRVCVRILMSACPLLALLDPWGTSLRPRLKALIRASNARRDWEVRLAWLTRWPEATRWQQRLLAQRPAGVERPEANEARCLLAEWAAQPPRLAQAAALPWDAWLAWYEAAAAEAVMADYDRLKAGKPARYHRLRLAIKQLRYLQLLQGAPAEALAPLRHWQTDLGDISDLTGLAAWLQRQGSQRLRRQVLAESLARQERLLGQRRALQQICLSQDLRQEKQPH
ncbi:CHAD domain-containing protein [Pseudaeromonas sp. ZJS20]|uniref:CHAD domain-containing protein n=1 Tax=Pseudaeromonas aegiceratis TaxID=3153928 RepID=UPI00390CB640